MKGTTKHSAASIKQCLTGIGLRESPECCYGYSHIIEMAQELQWRDDLSLHEIHDAYERVGAKYEVSADAISWRIKDYIYAYYDSMYMPLAPDIMEARASTGTLSNSVFIKRVIMYLKSNLK